MKMGKGKNVTMHTLEVCILTSSVEHGASTAKQYHTLGMELCEFLVRVSYM